MKTDGVCKKLQITAELLLINDQMIYPSRTNIPSWYKLNVLVPKDEHGVKFV